MINIVITSYGEPIATARAIQCFLNQNFKSQFKITVIDPFPNVEQYLKEKFSNKIEFFLDPGEGKAYALNIFLEKIYSKDSNDIIILTDGDVYVSKNALEVISKTFKNKTIGCVTARPVSLNNKNKFFGYASHVTFEGAHKIRLNLSLKEMFFECTGYLFAIRNGVLKGFPIDASEDSIIPYLLWKEGYKIKYLPEVEVYVLNPQNWKDFELQKIRNIKGHENLSNLAPDMPRTKSFANEIRIGTIFALAYPRNMLQVLYTFPLFITRFYIYLKAFYEIHFKKTVYQDGWRISETRSTKPLD